MFGVGGLLGKDKGSSYCGPIKSHESLNCFANENN
jgi:hypothetical protein